jgi:ribonucleoside-diphosphate reductase alpha chain
MKGFDAFAGVVKSGGTTRRAAKMVILDADHPDIVEFIDSKANEEKEGLGADRAGLRRVVHRRGLRLGLLPERQPLGARDRRVHARGRADADWTTHGVVDGKPAGTYKARELFRKMAEAAWICGDPGIQYDTTINDWHTSANTDRIYASNPCSSTCSSTTRRATWRRST